MKIVASRAIPTPCLSNHASNLLALDNGDLLCCWFGGSMEGSSDISIYLSRFDHAAGVWSEAVRMSDDAQRSEQNPALFRHPSGQIWLLYTAQLKTDQGTAIVRMRRSDDEGKSWAPIETLFDSEGTFIRHPPVVNPQGQILLPVWFSSMKNAFGNDRSLVQISDDGGNCWHLQEVPGSEGCVHMNILPDCRVAFYRRRKADHIFRSVSDDGGLTWARPEATSLPNNNSSIQAIGLCDGRLLIIYNHIGAAGRDCESAVPPWIQDKEAFLAQCEVTENSAIWGVPRNPLIIASSRDLGKSWQPELVVEDDPHLLSAHDSKGAFRGDYSYPSIIQTSDGHLQISYSYLRDYIKHVTLSIED
nr:sialidase family protein [uncultured Cohaesibacter sp.]